MIHCTTDEWPIVRMHFHSYPTYDEVMEWLDFCDQTLKQERHFVLISTFEPNYQFEHKARKQQSFWFKSAKEELAKWCLGMFRVTEDEVIIKKVQKPAMKRNMPFTCTIASTIEQADKLAVETLQAANISIQDNVI